MERKTINVRTISENKESKRLRFAIDVNNIELLLTMLFFALLIAYEAAMLLSFVPKFPFISL